MKNLILFVAANCLLVFAASGEVVMARPADAFVDSIGVNTHFGYRNTAYVQRFEECKKHILDADIRHIRDQAVNERNGADVVKRYEALTQNGVRICFNFFNHNTPASSIDERLATVRNHFSNSADYLENHNEPDMSWPDKQHWAAGSTEWLKELRAKAKADPVLKHIPIAGSALAHLENPTNRQLMGDLSALIDVANVHAYPGGRPNEARIGSYLDALKQVYGNHPVVVTETGYHTALENAPNKHKPASEEVKAIYLPTLLMDNFRRGVERSYIYQMVDNRPPNQKDQEAHFGLVSADIKPQPSYLALKNLMQLLRDPGNAQFKAASLEYSTPRTPPDLRTVLLQKKDGRFYLALWRPLKIWDEVTRKDLKVESAPLQIRFPKPLGSVRQFRPNDSSSPIQSAKDVNQLDLSLDARLLLLELQP